MKLHLFHSFCRIAICAGLLALGPWQAGAIINAVLQMQLGNPSGATADPDNHSHYLIQRPVEAIDYNDFLGLPNWVSWDLTASDVGSSGRSPDFGTDTSLPIGFYRVSTTDYSGSGFDRGHMCPSADRTDTEVNNELVFLMSNIIPQASGNNSGVWAAFESYCRSLAQSGNELLIICGPSGFNGALIQPSQRVFIPAYTWKIVVVVPTGSGTALDRITTATRVIALKIPNVDSVSSPWQNYVTSAAQIEVDTGFTFFTAMPAEMAAVLRNKVDGRIGTSPAIAGFSPPNGTVNSSLVITGANFSAVTAVTVNGMSAPFIVNSINQITAIVPTNSSAGPVSVTTQIGTAISTDAFTVTGSTVDLAVTETHFGNFSQGDMGDTYTITVSNVGTKPSSGSVTVTEALPAGLTATAISGVGWNVNLATLTCTRSNALLAGASYPPITVTVNVATNTVGSVTNTVTVTHSADTNPANNIARNVTIINPSVSLGNVVTLAAWDMNSLPGGANNFGVSPFAPLTNAPEVVVGGLTRGSGVSTSGTGAARGWGGTAFSSTTASAAATANQFVTFSLAVQAGKKLSLASINKFDYRRSNTGPASGVLQYQIGSGSFNDITALSYPANTSSGGSLSPINLTGVPALQNIGAGTNVTFRIVNYGGGPAGTWYIFDVAGNKAADFVVEGAIITAGGSDLSILLTHQGNFTQGDVGVVYSAVVTNKGTAATSGTVNVLNIPPAGLTVTAMTGAGWTTDLNTLTCTRSESLSPGTAYPPIQIIANVATNASLGLINLATVSNAGETITTNNSAYDPTIILALTPIQLWRLHWFGTTADAGDAADATVSTTDGFPNLVKYALGLDPLTPATNPVVSDIITGFFRVTLPKNSNATDVTIIVEAADQLSGPWATNGVFIEQNTPMLFRAHYNSAVNATTGAFLRFRVSRP